MSSTEKRGWRWSFSQWENYNGCPARWKYKSVLKLPSAPPGPAAARGLLIHSTIEDYIAQRTDVAHKDIKPNYYPIFDQYRNHPNGERHNEYRMSLADDWSIATPTTSERTWCVVILDAVRVGDEHKGPHSERTTPLIAHVGEWKSGKPKDTHADQRKLYALAAAIRWQMVDEVHVTTHYVEGTEKSQRLKVANTDSARGKLKELWERRVHMMRNDAICAPKPGMQCNWCDYSKRKGGPCVFGA